MDFTERSALVAAVAVVIGYGLRFLGVEAEVSEVGEAASAAVALGTAVLAWFSRHRNRTTAEAESAETKPRPPTVAGVERKADLAYADALAATRPTARGYPGVRPPEPWSDPSPERRPPPAPVRARDVNPFTL